MASFKTILSFGIGVLLLSQGASSQMLNERACNASDKRDLEAQITRSIQASLNSIKESANRYSKYRDELGDAAFREAMGDAVEDGVLWLVGDAFLKWGFSALKALSVDSFLSMANSIQRISPKLAKVIGVRGMEESTVLVNVERMSMGRVGNKTFFGPGHGTASAGASIYHTYQPILDKGVLDFSIYDRLANNMAWSFPIIKEGTIDPILALHKQDAPKDLVETDDRYTLHGWLAQTDWDDRTLRSNEGDLFDIKGLYSAVEARYRIDRADRERRIESDQSRLLDKTKGLLGMTANYDEELVKNAVRHEDKRFELELLRLKTDQEILERLRLECQREEDSSVAISSSESIKDTKESFRYSQAKSPLNHDLSRDQKGI